MNEIKTLNILIPVFNENQSITTTISNILETVKCKYAIYICYDYDEDPTLKVIQKYFPNNQKINFIKNFSRGFNNALISGIKKTNGDAVLIYMADDHDNHKLIDICYEKFVSGYDVICPSRFIEGGKMIGNPFLKAILTKIVSFFLYNFTTFPIKDTTNSFRLFSRELLKKINFESTKGFTLSMEITAKAHRLKMKMIEIPSTWREREKGSSRFNLISFILPYLKWLFYILKTSIFF